MIEYKERFYFDYEAIENDEVVNSRNLSFESMDGTDVYEIHRLVKVFLRACGFAQKSIEEVFGEDQYSE